MRSDEVRTKVLATIEMFNRENMPEARAELQICAGGTVSVRFAGCFCNTWYFHEYIEVFRGLLARAGVKATIVSIGDEGDDLLVVFEITE